MIGFFSFFEVWLVMPIPSGHHMDSGIYIYVCVCVCVYTHSLLILFSIMVYPRRLDVVPCAVQSDLIASSF